MAGWPAGRVDGGHVHKHALPGPTCKLEPARSKRVGFQVGAECGNNKGVVLMNQAVTAAEVKLKHALQLPQHKEGLILLD